MNERQKQIGHFGGQNDAGSNRNRIPDFVSDGGEEFGAVREVSPNGRPELVIYVRMRENLLCPSPQSMRYTRRRLS
jgi:hypothetical protein